MNSNFLSIKSWAEEDRPREKLQLKGVHALSDAELLAILISTGTQNESALDIAKRIVHLSGNCLQELGRYSLHDLTRLKE
jgi:DNA repair protein RadC